MSTVAKRKCMARSVFILCRDYRMYSHSRVFPPIVHVLSANTTEQHPRFWPIDFTVHFPSCNGICTVASQSPIKYPPGAGHLVLTCTRYVRRGGEDGWPSFTLVLALRL